VTLAALAAAHFAPMRATNFGGYDEWLVMDLTSRGIIALPYENRPLSLLFNLPGSWLSPDGLWGFVAVHVGYLLVSAWLIARLCGRLAPRDPALGFLAACFTLAWVPLDYMRLDPVLIANYSGATFGTLLAAALLVESAQRGSTVLALMSALLAFVVIRCLETTVGVLLAAPALLFLLPEARGRRVALLAWLAAVGGGLVMILLPLMQGADLYQTGALGLDAHPWHVAVRLLRQFGFHVMPLFTVRWDELTRPTVPIAVALVLLGWSALPVAAVEADRKRRLVVLAAGGAVFAALAYGPLVLSASVVTPARTQVLAAPGMGVCLAALACLSAGEGRSRWRRALPALAAAWVVGWGTARTAAMQREWDANSAWPRQRDLLAAITQAAPDLSPGTLIVLFGGERIFEATFPFRHAVHYLYDGHAVGLVQGGNDFLYPAGFTPQGIAVAPWAVIRGPWAAPARLYRYDEVVVVGAAEGSAAILERWPEALPPLPPGAGYAPWKRVRARTAGARRLSILSAP
jgi:hypothetical protein